jgi:hypothetical protein
VVGGSHPRRSMTRDAGHAAPWTRGIRLLPIPSRDHARPPEGSRRDGGMVGKGGIAPRGGSLFGSLEKFADGRVAIRHCGPRDVAGRSGWSESRTRVDRRRQLRGQRGAVGLRLGRWSEGRPSDGSQGGRQGREEPTPGEATFSFAPSPILRIRKQRDTSQLETAEAGGRGLRWPSTRFM